MSETLTNHASIVVFVTRYNKLILFLAPSGTFGMKVHILYIYLLSLWCYGFLFLLEFRQSQTGAVFSTFATRCFLLETLSKKGTQALCRR